MNVNFTDRMSRIKRNAEKEVKILNHKMIQPVHLLLACFNEKSGVLGEVSLKCRLDSSTLRALIVEAEDTLNQLEVNHDFFNVPVTEAVHLLKALLTTRSVNFWNY